VLTTNAQKVSYAIGLGIARDFQSKGIALEPESFSMGVRDAVSGLAPQLNDQEIEVAMQAFQQEVAKQQAAEMAKAGAQNRIEGEAFLAKNGQNPEITTLPSGLQYRVIKQGNGPIPKEGDTVTTHYRGILIDGTQFDSSYDRGEPATFPVGGVIAGWTEALQLMPVGSKWQLFIPAGLAYGLRGAGGVIGPDATLIFDIELLGIG